LNNTIVAIGGQNTTTPALDNVEYYYDGAWHQSESSNLNVARTLADAVVVGTNMYIIGGLSNTKPVITSIEKIYYDSCLQTWKCVLLPDPASGFGFLHRWSPGNISTAVGDKIVTVGGRTYSDDYTKIVQIYDPDPNINKWVTGPDFPVSIHMHSVVSIGNEIYVIGGYTPSGWTSAVYKGYVNTCSTDVQSYNIVAIPLLADRPTMFPIEINKRGQVVGRVHQGPVWQGYDYRGFFWDIYNSYNVTIELSYLTEATGINDSGQVVGYLDPPRQSYIYKELNDIILGNLPVLIPYATGNFALDINNHGWVVGATTSSPSSYIWKEGSNPVDLGVLPGYSVGWATAVNDERYVVGACQIQNDSMAYICDGTADGMRVLLPIGSDPNSYAWDINNNGQVVGWSGINNGAQEACLWQTNGTNCVSKKYLALVPGYSYSQAQGINDCGQVVGHGWNPGIGVSDETRYRAFLWDENNGLRDLNDLIPQGTGWYLAQARSINNSGQITGYGLLNGVERAFVMIPPLAQPGQVTVQLIDSNGNGIQNAEVYYADGQWVYLGATDWDGKIVHAFPEETTNLKIRLSYGGRAQEITQNIQVNPIFTFRTLRAVTVLQDSSGEGIQGGGVAYSAGSWWSFGVGTTDANGEVSTELLPGTYTIRMTWGGRSKYIEQDVGTRVVFQTQLALVKLLNSTGAGLSNAQITYSAGSWWPFGVTDGNGEARKELLPGDYTVRMSRGGISKDKTLTVGTPLEFQTGSVVSDSGTCTFYAGGSWRPFTNQMELLPNSIKFRFKDGTPDTYYSINAGTVNHIH
jgi:probable HAF family extracellular repeat protein